MKKDDLPSGNWIRFRAKALDQWDKLSHRELNETVVSCTSPRVLLSLLSMGPDDRQVPAGAMRARQARRQANGFSTRGSSQSCGD